MKKTVLGLVLVGMLGLVGCGGGQQTEAPAQTDTQAVQTDQAGGTSVNVNDQGVNVQSGDTSVNVNPEGGVSVETGK